MSLQNTKSSLNAEISQMVTFLEKGSLEGSSQFFTRYAVPEELVEKLEQENKLQDLIESFHSEKSSLLLNVLTQIQSETPLLHDDGYTYEYAIINEGQKVASLMFKWDQQTERFYLHNN